MILKVVVYVFMYISHPSIKNLKHHILTSLMFFNYIIVKRLGHVLMAPLILSLMTKWFPIVLEFYSYKRNTCDLSKFDSFKALKNINDW